jgi:hypothetical protein
MKRVCLISGAHLSSNPRIVKEADSLVAAGYDVLVLTTQSLKFSAEFDAELHRTKSWKVKNIELYKRSLWTKWRNRVARDRAQEKILKGERTAETFCAALAPWNGLHLQALQEFQPDLIIAHTLGPLATAAMAARRWKMRYAFDMEDYHPGEQAGGSDQTSNRIAFSALEYLLPESAYVTAASPGIAEQVGNEFRRNDVITILNTFPIETVHVTKKDKTPLLIYWFSQVLGLDRGLRDLFEACEGLRGDFELHLRGYMYADVKVELMKEANHHDLAKRLYLYDWCAPDEVIRLAAEYDVGVALEDPLSPTATFVSPTRC